MKLFLFSFGLMIYSYKFEGIRNRHMSVKETREERCVQALLISNYKKYYRVAYSYCSNPNDAMDIVQESAYKAIKYSNSLKHIEYADTWICKIVINTAIKMMNNKKSVIYELDESIPYVENFEQIYMKDLVSSLEEPERSIVMMRFFEDYKLEDISKVLDMNLSTVKSKLYRGLRKLKKELENKEDRSSVNE